MCTGNVWSPTSVEFDAWNRLVRVGRPAPSSIATTTNGGVMDPYDTVDHRYNGLSWRTVEWRRQARRWSTAGAGSQLSAASILRVRWFTYTGGWQVAQERLWRPWLSGSKSWIEHQMYGLRGTDDAVYRRVDAGSGIEGFGSAGDGVPDGCFGSDLPTISSIAPPGDQLDGGYYQLSDSQFSVVAAGWHRGFLESCHRTGGHHCLYRSLTVRTSTDARQSPRPTVGVP
ncbi:MAG: hypothetical protein Q8L55_13420 [Phycisphaerales bacterium]|nr:hypothetical protein [Phycisphaerales bacterium]